MILQIFLWVIVIISGLVAYEFYKSKDGQLRILIIELFLAKIVVYGGGAMFYAGWLTFASPEVIKILMNLPMFIVMLRLYRYIRLKR